MRIMKDDAIGHLGHIIEVPFDARARMMFYELLLA